MYQGLNIPKTQNKSFTKKKRGETVVVERENCGTAVSIKEYEGKMIIIDFFFFFAFLHFKKIKYSVNFDKNARKNGIGVIKQE